MILREDQKGIASGGCQDYSFVAKKIYKFALILSVFVAGGCMAVSSQETIYKIVFLLPLAYALMNRFFSKAYECVTIPVAIVHALMFVRYCLSPLILILEGFPNGLYSVQFNTGTMVYAIFLMIYEMLVLFFALSKIKVYSGSVTDEEYTSRILKKTNFSELNVIAVAFLVFTLAIYCIFPSLFTNYSFIASPKLADLTYIRLEAQKDLPFGMRWIGDTCGEVARFVLMQWLMMKLFKRYTATGEIKYWWISVIVVTANACIATTSTMMGLFMALVLYCQIYKLYPVKRKFMFRVGIAGGCVAMTIIILTYLSIALGYHSFAQMVQDYTNGYYNVYQVRNAYVNAGQGFLDKVVMFLLGDSLGNVNIISRFIDAVNSSDIYNFYLYNAEFNGGAVVPLVSQMAYYFTPVLGPWAAYACVYGLRKCEDAVRTGRGSSFLYSFVSIIFATTPFMYNYSTVIHIITLTALPLWVLAVVNEKVNLRFHFEKKRKHKDEEEFSD